LGVWQSHRAARVQGGFGTWAGEAGYEDRLIDIALAHAVSSDVLRRCQRSDKAELGAQ
jgi:hypothetical protein